MAAEKCCFCFKLELGCLLIGTTTFVVSLVKIIMTFVFILPEHSTNVVSKAAPDVATNGTHRGHVNSILTLVSDVSVKTIVVGFVMIVCLLWMVISVLLIFGICKKKVTFVMTYFLFGIAMSIMYLLSGLLLIISGFWITGLFTIILTLVYIKCLTSVYAAYDKMRQMKADDREQLIIDEPVIEC